MQITTPYIKLDSFLKAENAVASGGEAKLMIAEGYVSVNGVVELRRGRKLYPGDKVAFGKRHFVIESSEEVSAADGSSNNLTYQAV